ncbi:MAG: 2,3-bisphosphoglycerate-independent phosphoglycerate mutase [Endomicrobiia bacterium]|nr:2,3-bisphosphoglycerate-independent phosphoglycerate mutase [Endomicrobiia bacterium]
MITQEFVRKLVVKNDAKIVLLVMDGLGGIQHPELEKTELEVAKHNILDMLAAKSECGFHYPIGVGITPGSGPAHLGLFGYDPLRYEIGRGLLDSLGVDFEFQKGDLAARGNFATAAYDGAITDRRAGRIASDASAKICKILDGAELDGVKIFVLPVKEHRFAVVFRPSDGKILSDRLTDSDPQKEGLKNLEVKPTIPEAAPAASVINKFISYADEKLKKSSPANAVLLRGFANMIDIPAFGDVFGLRALCIATYPMYKGLSRLVGMDVAKDCDTLISQFEALKKNFDKYDFFFVHIKATDSAGEDGDFSRKVKAVEDVDLCMPDILSLEPAVLVVTGDHSTPAAMKSHSWHPVPLMVHSKCARFNPVVKRFTETEFIKGSLGRVPASSIMTLALSHARRLAKFGA